jgi:2-dehydropantoate 2-reductase
MIREEVRKENGETYLHSIQSLLRELAETAVYPLIVLIDDANQCIANKRMTEVDRINGAVVSEAAKVGMEAPLNKLLTDLVHAKEKTY